MSNQVSAAASAFSAVAQVSELLKTAVNLDRPFYFHVEAESVETDTEGKSKLRLTGRAKFVLVIEPSESDRKGTT
jgi:hypothetical protein